MYRDHCFLRSTRDTRRRLPTGAFVALLALTMLVSAALVATARAEIVIESVSPSSPYPGQSVHLDGFGFGDDAALGTVLVNGNPDATVTFWSDELVIFTMPFLAGETEAVIEASSELGGISNPMLVHPDYPTDFYFVNLMPGHVASGSEVTVQVAPEFDGGQVELVTFMYRPAGELFWSDFAVDDDGDGPVAGTTTWAGEGDGWSATLSLIDLPEGVYDLRAEAIDVHGQLMGGEFSFLYDPTPLAPHILVEESELGATTQDEDELEVEIEMTDDEIEALLLALFPIEWHKQRELKKIDQDTLRVIDKLGNDVSDQACGPAAAASCLTWFRDRFPDLDKDPAELARKIAKAAGTGAEGTHSDDLVAAIKKILKECGQDPDDWGVSSEFDAKKVYKDMVQGLNKEGTDKIPLIFQKSTVDVNGDDVVDDKDVTGHYVTLSSRGSRYRDVMIPPTTHLIVLEKFVDFFNPATGQTEEYQIDDTKQPPELIGYDMTGSSTGNAWIEGVICVRPPAPSSDRVAGGAACGWGHPLDEPVFEVLPVSGPGTVTWRKMPVDLPFGPGPALLGVFGRDIDECISGELYTEILVGGFANVDFAADVTEGEPPLVVTFANLTAPVDSVVAWEWDFDGDGQTDSTDEHPTFSYGTPGLYSVSLRAHNPHGSDHRVHENVIEVFDVVGADEAPDATQVTRLLPASPNPLRVATSLRFELAEASAVRLAVYDVQGRAVWRESWTAADAGVHAVRWDARDGRGRDVSSGVYFVRLETSLGVEQWGTVRVVR